MLAPEAAPAVGVRCPRFSRSSAATSVFIAGFLALAVATQLVVLDRQQVLPLAPSRGDALDVPVAEAVHRSALTSVAMAWRWTVEMWWARPQRRMLTRRCQWTPDVTPEGDERRVMKCGSSQPLLNDSTLAEAAAIAAICATRRTCDGERASNQAGLDEAIVAAANGSCCRNGSGGDSGGSRHHPSTVISSTRLLPFFPFTGVPRVWQQALALNRVTPPSGGIAGEAAATPASTTNPAFESILASGDWASLERFSAASSEGQVRTAPQTRTLLRRFNCSNNSRIRRGAHLPFYNVTPPLIFNPRLWMQGGAANVDAASYLCTRTVQINDEHGVPRHRDEERLSFFAQKRIADSQLLPHDATLEAARARWKVLLRAAKWPSAEEKGERALPSENPREVEESIDSMCRSERLLLVETRPGFGIGATISLMARALAHAMILGRKLVIHSNWRRWTGTASAGCASRGWECFFLPPSPCRDNAHVGQQWAAMARSGELRMIKGRAKVLTAEMNATRIIWRRHYRSGDLPTRQLPDLHPPGMTRAEVERRTGLTYDRWAMAQLLRYLLRGMQPWTEEMVVDHMQRSGYPWLANGTTLRCSLSPPPLQPGPVPAFVIAAHHRNGEALKDKEIAPVMRCMRMDSSHTLFFAEGIARALAETYPEALAITDATASIAAISSARRPIQHFFSFDEPSIVAEAAKFWGQPWKVHTAAFPHYNFHKRKGVDSREVMKDVFGPEHVAKVSIVNLFLSVAADAWVNNDLSNWCAVINSLRMTLGDGRHQAPYLDVRQLALSSMSLPVLREFCSVP